jgi:hypothetical protein
VLFSTFLNPLINPAKQLLVMGRSVREAHEAILAQYEERGDFASGAAPLARWSLSEHSSTIEGHVASSNRKPAQTFSRALTGKKPTAFVA